MKNLLIAFILLIAALPLVVTAQTAKAPTKKAPTTQTTKKPATQAPAKNNQTALPKQNTPTRSTNNATALPNKTPAKSSTSPATGGGDRNATKLPAGSSTVAPSRQPVRQYSSASKRSSSSYRSSSRRSSGGYGFEKGDGLINLGVGLTNYYSNRIPIGLSYEHGFTDDISAGAQLDYMGGGTRYNYSVTYFGVRGSYHFNRILNLNDEKFDIYAGLGLGYQSWRPNSNISRNYYSYSSGLFFNYFVGGKYYFTDKVGAFLELGYTGISSSRIGLSFKF